MGNGLVGNAESIHMTVYNDDPLNSDGQSNDRLNDAVYLDDLNFRTPDGFF